MTDSTFGSTATADRSTTEQVNDQVRDKAQLAQDKARGALGQGRSRLRDQIDQRSTQAGEQVQSTAQDVRSMAEQLRGQGKDTPARVAEQVADRAESFGSYLRDADGERLLRDVEDVARRQPWLVAAGGLALGFAASRFLKASSSRRYQSGDDRSSAGHSAHDATWPTGARSTSTPAANGSETRLPKPTWSRRPLAATLRPPSPSPQSPSPATPSAAAATPTHCRDRGEATMTTQHPSTVGDPRDTDELRERSLPELLKQLSADTTRLVHQELDLAKAELTQKGRQAGAGAGLFGAAGAIGLLGAAALTTCFILALDAVMPAWLAALLVAAVYGVIALVVAKQGQAKLKAAGPPVPTQTIETVKEDVVWAKTQVRSEKT